MFKIGDRVRVNYNKHNGDWNQSGATVAIVEYHYIEGTSRLFLLDGNRKSYSNCCVDTKDLVLDIIWDSPLYSELK